MKTVWKQILTLALVLTMLFSSVLPGLSVDLKASAFDQKSFTVTKTLRDAFSVENSGNGGITLFSASSNYDGCFGNQLEAEAKAIYDHFVSAYAVNRQAGEMTYTFSSPFTFQTAIVDGDFVKNEEYQEISETISVAFQSAMDAFLYDYPDVFWFRSGSYSFGIRFSGSSYSNMTGTISSAVFTPAEIYSGAASKISSYDNKVLETVNTIRSAVGTDADRMSVLKYVHDYICNNAYYNLTGEAKVHSSEPFFIGDGGVVCEGYAKTFKVLCDKLSLPCACVSGTAKTSDGKNEAHMWNLVQMEDGKWYLVDVTWDDQTSKIYDTYFLAGSSSAGFNDIISKERTESTDFSSTGWKNFVYPVLSSDKYTPHVHSWNDFYTVDTATTCTNTGSKSIHCSLCSAQKDITPVPALGHDFTEKIADNAHLKSSATCTKKAEYYYDCSRCSQISGTEYYEYGDALGHDMGNWYVSTASTCNSGGESKRDCKRCSYSETKMLQPTNHANQYSVPEQAATCKTNGYTVGVYCPDCKTWLSGHEVIPVKEHTYIITITVPTCTKDGYTTHRCSACGDTYTDSKIPAKGHTVVTDKAVTPTCVKSGKTEGKHCSVCKAVITAQNTVPATGKHTYETATAQATITKDGQIVKTCKVCKKSITTVIYKASFVKLSASSYVYDGKVKTPSVTVKDSKGKTLKNGTDYTVVYASGRKHPGQYAVKITFKGNYSGSKTLYFTILPGKTSKLTATQTTSSIKATWNKVTGTSGYKVTLYTSKNKAVKTVDTTKATYTFSKLSKGTTYKVRVTAYKTIDGKKVSSSVYTQLTTVTKPGTPTLKVTAGPKKATLSWNKQTGATGYVIYMATSKNGKYSKIATLKGNSSVTYTKTGLTKGKTYYFKVAAYTVANGKTLYSSYSSVKAAKIK